jgi:Carboxypeptidase regulatory-like domain
MRKKRFSFAPSLLAAILFFFLCSHLNAQYENGSLVGTIHDSSGAIVSGASVTITNNATGITAKATSNSSGDYEIPSLRVGVYTISAKSPGFSDAVAKNITVSVGVRERIDLSLQVGSTQTTVEVSDVALQIETETSQRGQTITQYQSAAFPLVSRNYSDLLGLVTGSRQAPTAATTSSINSLVRAGAYNINGQRSMFNNFLLDGMDNNAYGESNQGFDNQIIAIPPTPSPNSRSSPTTRARSTAAPPAPPSTSLRTAEPTNSTPPSTSSSATPTSTPPATSSPPSSAPAAT